MPVLAYHVVLSTYGFWLPNDPRGSNSREVRAANIKPFGPATLVTHTRRSVASQVHDQNARLAAKAALLRQPVMLDGHQALSVATGFAAQVAKSGYQVFACSILPCHAHLVIGRYSYSIEQVIRLMKQAATAQLLADGRHPFGRRPDGRVPSVWGQDFRKVFLSTPAETLNRIGYVEANPEKEGKRRQRWSFVIPFVG